MPRYPYRVILSLGVLIVFFYLLFGVLPYDDFIYHQLLALTSRSIFDILLMQIS
jgi:hypothetical protein